MDDQIPGYFRVDQSGEIKAWDERMAEMTGYEVADVVGRSMALLIPETYIDRHWHGFRTAMSRGETKHNQPALNVPLRHKDGTVVLHPAREIFLRDGFGASVGVLAIIHSSCQPGENDLPSPYDDAISE